MCHVWKILLWRVSILSSFPSLFPSPPPLPSSFMLELGKESTCNMNPEGLTGSGGDATHIPQKISIAFASFLQRSALWCKSDFKCTTHIHVQKVWKNWETLKKKIEIPHNHNPVPPKISLHVTILWVERVALTYIHYYVRNRQLVGTCCVARGAQLGALWWPRQVR